MSLSATSPQETIRAWIEFVLGIPVINAEQDDPTAPRRLKEAEVDTYAALEIASDDSTSSTNYEHTGADEINTVAEEEILGSVTPASEIEVASVFGFDLDTIARFETAGGNYERAVVSVDAVNKLLQFATDALDFDIALLDTVFAQDTVEYTDSLIRRGDMPIEFYGQNAWGYARALQLAIGGPSYLNTFSNLNIALAVRGEITDEPVLRSATRETGASMMLGFEWTDSAAGAIGAAAEVEIDATAMEESP